MISLVGNAFNGVNKICYNNTKLKLLRLINECFDIFLSPG